MPQPLMLEDFGAGPGAFHPETIDGTRLEAERLEAFDKGYAAGWDDATEAARQERDTAEEAARARLQELGFTFHEARAHVMMAMTPLLEGIVTQILPPLIRETLGARILDELQAMADSAGEAPVEMLVPEGEAELLRLMLESVTSLPLTLREEAALEPGQLYLRLGEVEREIDLAAIGTRIADAVAALDILNKDTVSNG